MKKDNLLFKSMFMLILIYFGTYALYFPDLLNETNINYVVLFRAVLLSIVPLLYLIKDFKFFFNKFSFISLLTTFCFIFSSVSLLFAYTIYSANNLEQYYMQHLQDKGISTQMSHNLHQIELINIKTLIIISFLSFILLCYFNLKSDIKMTKKEIIFRLFLFFLIQGLFTFFVLSFIYLGV